MGGRATPNDEATPPRREPLAARVPGLRWWLAIALVKGLALAALIPPFQTPDEYAHYDYALYLSKISPRALLAGEVTRPTAMSHATMMTAEVRAVAEAAGTLAHLTDAVLPSRRGWTGMLDAASAWREDAEHDLARIDTWNAVMNYPPLYHGVAGALLKAQRAAGVNPLLRFYSVRLLSLLFFLAALYAAAVALAHLEVPRLVRSTALGVIALHPQLSMMSVSVQPDVLALLLVTAAFAVALGFGEAQVGPRARRRSAWRAVAFGAVLGALLLTKPHDVPPLVAAAAACGLGAVAAGLVPPREALRVGAIAAAAACVVGGWWLLRSQWLYGNLLGLVLWTPAPGASTVASNLSAWWHVALPLSFRSYWGVWGWLDYGVDGWMVGPLLGWTLLPAALLAVRVAAEPGPRRLSALVARLGVATTWRTLLLALAMGVFALEMLWVAATMGMVQAQGRQWLPFVLPQALYLALPVALLGGTSAEVIARWASRHARPLRVAIAALLAGAAVAGSAAIASRPGAFVELRMRITGDGLASLFHDAGAGFTVAEVHTREVRRRDGEGTYRFPIASGPVSRLRLDLTGGVGQAVVSRLDVVGRNGTALAAVPLPAVRLVAGERLEPADDAIVVTPGEVAILEWTLPAPVAFSVPGGAPVEAMGRTWVRVHRRWPWTQALVLWWAPMLLGALAAAVILAMGRGLRRASLATATITLAVLALMNVWLAALTWEFYR